MPTSLALLCVLGSLQSAPASTDWITLGTDCVLITAGDVDADGFADVVTLNGPRDLCMAPSVHGWKSAPWRAIASDVAPGEVALVCADLEPEAPGEEVALVYPDHARVHSALIGGRLTATRRVEAPQGVILVGAAPSAGRDAVRAADGTLLRLGPSGFARLEGGAEEVVPAGPPPYEPDAPVLTTCRADVTGDGVADTITTYTCTRPYAHRVVRVAPGPAEGTGDLDDDGLSDDEERALGCDPLDRDTDGDGLLDGWEVHGLPRGVELGERIPPFRADATGADAEAQLDPRRQDVVVAVSLFEGLEPASFEAQIPGIQRLFRELDHVNPDGTRGLVVHVRLDPVPIPTADQSRPWWELGSQRLAASERGLLHWMQVTPWGGGQSSETGDMGGSGCGWDVFAHEFGHQLSLSHTGDSGPAWCPLYTSLMSYAFSYGFDGSHERIHFSDGRFRGTDLDERSLSERLPYPFEQLAYLAQPPFRFRLEDAGDGTTRIDWNHDGRFEEQPVQADVNYGGSTYCGVRREQEAIGSAPALAYVGDTCWLVAADRTRDHLWLKSCLGGEAWSEARVLADSGTERDPVLVGGPDHGLVLHHHLYGWRVTRFDAASVGQPAQIPDLPTCELNACRVGERVLVVSRHDDDRLEARWLEFEGGDASRPRVGAPQALSTRSQVTPGLGVDPADGRIVLVSAADNSHGARFCMRVTWARVDGDRLVEEEPVWTRGEASGNGCCSRPVVAFAPDGPLNVFHQGGPDGGGQKIAYRTSRVGDASLDEGWLTCMLYDVWTRSRVPVGFASGPQGAIFAYRWDAGGDHVNWLATAHDGFGIDREPMRDFDDGAKVCLWGIRHSILTLQPDAP